MCSTCHHRNTLGFFSHQRRAEATRIAQIGKSHGAQAVEGAPAAGPFAPPAACPPDNRRTARFSRSHSARATSALSKAPSCASRVPTGIDSADTSGPSAPRPQCHLGRGTGPAWPGREDRPQATLQPALDWPGLRDLYAQAGVGSASASGFGGRLSGWPMARHLRQSCAASASTAASCTVTSSSLGLASSGNGVQPGRRASRLTLGLSQRRPPRRVLILQR